MATGKAGVVVQATAAAERNNIPRFATVPDQPFRCRRMPTVAWYIPILQYPSLLMTAAKQSETLVILCGRCLTVVHLPAVPW